MLAGNEKPGFVGDGVAGVAGVVETGAEFAGAGVVNENGASGALAGSGAVALPLATVGVLAGWGGPNENPVVLGGSEDGAGVKLNSFGGSAAGVVPLPNNPAGAPGFVGSTTGVLKENGAFDGSVTTTDGTVVVANDGAKEKGRVGVAVLVARVGGGPKLNPPRAGAGFSDTCSVP